MTAPHPFKPGDVVYCEGRTRKGRHLNGKWWTVESIHFCGSIPYMYLEEDHTGKHWGMYGFTKDKEMLHIAIKVRPGENYDTLASTLTCIGNGSYKPDLLADALIADVTPHALKERLKARVMRNPDERWLMLSGNTIAETSMPPVSFRQW